MRTWIRPAEVDDLPNLLAWMQEYYDYDAIEFHEAIALSALSELLGDSTLGGIWLICRDTLAVGYIVLTYGYSLEFGGRDAFIDELYIQEASRGQGIGAEALALVESAARLLGIGALHLEVERGNKDAQRFYRSRGFEDRGRFRLMSKRL